SGAQHTIHRTISCVSTCARSACSPRSNRCRSQSCHQRPDHRECSAFRGVQYPTPSIGPLSSSFQTQPGARVAPVPFYLLNDMSTRLHDLHAAGQSIWLDYIDRTMLGNGDLARRIREDALTGMTSNPTIFEKALAEGHAYDAQLLEAAVALDTRRLFEL